MTTFTRLIHRTKAASASFGPAYVITANVAPSAGQHGPQFVVSGVEVFRSDPTDPKRLEGRLSLDAFTAETGITVGELSERLIDKHVANNTPKARKSGKAA